MKRFVCVLGCGLFLGVSVMVSCPPTSAQEAKAPNSPLWQKALANGASLMMSAFDGVYQPSQAEKKFPTQAEADQMFAQNPQKYSRFERIRRDRLWEYRLEWQDTKTKRLLHQWLFPYYSGSAPPQLALLDADFDGTTLTYVAQSVSNISSNAPRSLMFGESFIPPLNTSLTKPVQQNLLPDNFDAVLTSVVIEPQTGRNAKTIRLKSGAQDVIVWEVYEGKWRLIQPYQPKVFSSAEIALQRKKGRDKAFMGQYAAFRGLGWSQQKAIEAVRKQSGFKDWEPLVEAWDTPDLVAKKYWITPTPAPTPKPEPPPAKEQ